MPGNLRAFALYTGESGVYNTIRYSSGFSTVMVITAYATLINQKVVIPSSRTNYVSVDKSHFVDFMKPLLKKIYVDPEWYIRFYPDVSRALSDGTVETASEHYTTFGYYEHRMPYEIEVDESWYLSQYPDVANAVANGLFSSAQEHYYVVGFQEGRLPHANFSLKLST